MDTLQVTVHFNYNVVLRALETRLKIERAGWLRGPGAAAVSGEDSRGGYFIKRSSNDFQN